MPQQMRQSARDGSEQAVPGGDTAVPAAHEATDQATATGSQESG